MHRMFEAMETEPAEAEASEEPPDRMREILQGPSLRVEHPQMLAYFARRLEATQHLSLHELADDERAVKTELALLPNSEMVFTRRAFQSLDFTSGAFRFTHAHLRCLIATVAAERYRLTRGRWPAELAELAPAFIASVPIDPFDGKPLRYSVGDDGVKIYSVGPDMVDDGGHLNSFQNYRAGADLGIHLRKATHSGRPASLEPGAKP